VVRVTGNFTSEAPLSDLAKEALLACLDDGWANPRKISQLSSKAAILRDHSLEAIAAKLSLSVSQIEVLGEISIGHHLAISGLLSPASHLYHCATDRSEVFAIAQNHSGPVTVIPVTRNGVRQDVGHVLPGAVLALEMANNETGTIHSYDQSSTAQMERSLCAIDATTSGTRLPLPNFWNTALYDARSWGGPAGIGVLAINGEGSWRNPLPHISSSRSPQTFSLPLLVSAAVALENFDPQINRIRDLSKRLRANISSAVDDCDIAGDLETSLEHITSFSFLYCEGEELLRKLSVRGFSVDSGSACTAMDLQPSHVLAAMGVLTHGNIRITIHPDTSAQEVDRLEVAIVETVAELRGAI
jgi:cysteine desulfurase